MSLTISANTLFRQVVWPYLCLNTHKPFHQFGPICLNSETFSPFHQSFWPYEPEDAEQYTNGETVKWPDHKGEMIGDWRSGLTIRVKSTVTW